MLAGTRVGHFELLDVLGRGGMGEVWRARDTRLGRDVALKTLPAPFTDDADRVAGLEREAQFLAALNHPNIAGIHGLEEKAGTYWLVLELVEGPTLDERLDRGRIPFDEAMRIAMQVAEALEAAHARGIIHRDLKPANIKLSPDGRVKVLDFGIARALEVPDHAPADQSTMIAPRDVAGTPAYMSPEQLRGERPAVTSDIWAFGILLFQMLAGRVPFRGNTLADTTAAVLNAPPDWSLLPEDVPGPVLRLLRRCLEKEPRQRIQHAGDIRILLEDALEAPDPARQGERAPRRARVLGGLLLLALIALGITAWKIMQRDAAQPGVAPVRADLVFEDSNAVSPAYEVSRIAISPDGSRVAVAARDVVWIRGLGSSRAVAVGTACGNPAFSPDGAWVACITERPGLVKFPAAGGQPVALANVSERPSGLVWTPEGSILFTTSEGLFRVLESGGEPELIATPDADRGERQYAWPSLLPDGRSLLLTVLWKDPNVPPRIIRFDLPSRTATTVLDGGTAPKYVRGGYLVFAANDGLRTVRFDPESATVRSEIKAVPDVDLDIAGANQAASYAIAANGTMVFLARITARRPRQLHWVDAKGVDTLIPAPPGGYTNPRVSPDGRRLAMDITVENNRDIYVFDMDRRNFTRVTADLAEDVLPEWSPDGSRVFFSSNRAGSFDVYSQAVDGSDTARLEYTGPGTQMVANMAPGGELIIVEDFRRLAVFDPRKHELRPLLNEGAEYWLGSVSPDGRWIAYESTEAGSQVEIFLRPFPAVAGRREKISVAGGRYPLWGPPGSNVLYYVQTDGQVMRAEVRLSPTLQLGAVTPIFEWNAPVPRISGYPYDLSPVNGRFLLTRAVPEVVVSDPSLRATLVINWLAELQRLFPEQL